MRGTLQALMGDYSRGRSVWEKQERVRGRCGTADDAEMVESQRDRWRRDRELGVELGEAEREAIRG